MLVSYRCVLDLYCVLLQMEFMGVVCRDAVNDCDIPENCTGNSSQVSINVFFSCSNSQKYVIWRVLTHIGPMLVSRNVFSHSSAEGGLKV